MNYILARLKEASTWRGIAALITAAGVSLSPAQSDAIVAAGLSIIGLIAVFFKDTGASV
jgi:C4-dicarboxylate transporter